MKILVTGAAGFIGSYVSRALIWRGDEVVGIDNFNDYYPRKCKEFNINLTDLAAKNPPTFQNKGDSENIVKVFDKLKNYHGLTTLSKIKLGKFVFKELDIIDFDKLTKLFAKEKFDAVIHLAAMAGVPLSIKKPKEYTQVNVDGTVNLVTAGKDNGLKKFVFGSSSSVYGNRDDKKVTEEDDVMHPVSPYGASKVAGEVLLHSASKVYKIDVVIARIFGPIYGPLQRPYGMFMQRAINYVYNNKTVQVYGRKGLDSAKDSTYIDDQVNGLLKCLDYKTKFDVFNIGTSDPKSIKDWFYAIEKNYGRKVNYEIINVDKGDVASSADISKARMLLGYAPKVSLDEGVARQIEVFNLMPDWYKKLSTV
ncbi:GDP-mannose 4,6-dehydratase [candidate division WWE3 bacterium]|nr:GDP-mannose 4,6-dehydratase [candidate division WWE3 bacterium]